MKLFFEAFKKITLKSNGINSYLWHYYFMNHIVIATRPTFTENICVGSSRIPLNNKMTRKEIVIELAVLLLYSYSQVHGYVFDLKCCYTIL